MEHILPYDRLITQREKYAIDDIFHSFINVLIIRLRPDYFLKLQTSRWVTFLFLVVSVASLFLDMRDLLPETGSGRFAPSAAVVIFYYFDVSVASPKKVLT